MTAADRTKRRPTPKRRRATRQSVTDGRLDVAAWALRQVVRGPRSYCVHARPGMSGLTWSVASGRCYCGNCSAPAETRCARCGSAATCGTRVPLPQHGMLAVIALCTACASGAAA